MSQTIPPKRRARRSRSFVDIRVAEAFASYPDGVAERLMMIRDLIFETAAAVDGVGEIEETLRWGQPAYITRETNSGSLIRLGPVRTGGDYGVFFHCGTTLVESMRERYPNRFRFQGNRALVFDAADAVPKTELAECFRLALTYRLRARE